MLRVAYIQLRSPSTQYCIALTIRWMEIYNLYKHKECSTYFTVEIFVD